MRRFVAVLLIGLAGVMGAVAGAQSEAAAASAEPVIIEFALSGNPDTLDPHKTAGTLTFQTIRSVYDTLVEPDKEGKLVPALAESWTVSADNRVWTFSLRRGVTFHNGDAFTSADVKATLERITDPEIASSKANEFGVIQAIETPDDHTVVLRLAEPHAPLLASLASGWGAILPKGLIDAGHDFGTEPVGTGPFVLKEFVRDNRVVYERNPDYWMAGHPKVDGVNINIITEAAVQLQGLLAGELDIIDTVNDTDIERLRSNAGTKLDQSISALVMVLAMNTSREPLSNLKVRQAVNHAVDKQQVLDVAYNGGEVVGTFMDVSDPYYVDHVSLYPYDPAKARTLLAEAQAEGVDVAAELELALPQNYEKHVKAGEIYHEMLSQVGLNVKIRLVDWSTWISDVYRGGNYDLTAIGHTGKLDPHGRLSGYGIPDKNYVKWENQRVAQVFDQAKSVVDFGERTELYAEGLAIMARQVPHVYVGSPYRYLAMRSNVYEMRMDTKLDTYDFRYVEKR